MKLVANIGDETPHFVEFVRYDTKCYLVHYAPGISFKMKRKQAYNGEFRIVGNVSQEVRAKESDLQGALINSIHGFHWE